MSQVDLAPVPADFFTKWTEWFPDGPPVGFLLRDAEPDRWLRIHSLPGSTRYPSSGWDHAELLRRHNAVATDLLGEDAPCVAVLFKACRAEQRGGLGKLAGLTDADLPMIGTLPPELWDEHEGIFVEPVCLFGGATTWRAGAFNAFISAVADGRVSGLLVALGTGAAYAPYDGGADLFFTTTWERDLARDRYRAWLSQQSSGM